MPAPIGEEVVIPAREEVRLTYYYITDFHAVPGRPGSPVPLSAKLVRAGTKADGTPAVESNDDGTMKELSVSIPDVKALTPAQIAAAEAVASIYPQIRAASPNAAIAALEFINQTLCAMLKAEGTIK